MSDSTATDAAVASYLRRAIGTALVQSGWMDRDDPDEADLLAFQNCDGCDRTRCACSGVPFLSSLIWDQIDKFGDLSKAVELIRRNTGEQIATFMEACVTCGKVHEYRTISAPDEVTQRSWADPADGHTYRPRVSGNALYVATAIARGSVAGKPDTQGGHSG